MRSPSDARPWREPWSGSPQAAGPRPWSEALERAISRMHEAGHSVQAIATAIRLPEHRVQQILREHMRAPR
jgi:hypothetical protein